MKTEMTINVRPLRLVYFIAENDLARFTEVATFCCTQWGGINNLIIPIPSGESKETEILLTNKDSSFVQIIKRRNPDIFIDAVSLADQESGFYNALMPWLASEYTSKHVIKWETFLSTNRSLHPLQIRPLNFTPSLTNPSKPVLLLAAFPPYAEVSELEKAIIYAAFGKIWPGQERDYEEVYELRKWQVDMPGASLHTQLSTDPYASVINLTLKEMQNSGTEEPLSSPHFDAVIAQTVVDLCWFWNLRAYSFGHQWLFDRRVFILGKNQLLQEAYFEPLLRIVRERRIHPYIKSNIDVIFHHNQDPEVHQFLKSHSEFQELQDDLELTVRSHRLVFNDGENFDADIGVYRPASYAENIPSGLSVYHEYGGNRPTFSLTLTEDSESFLVPSSGPQTLNYGNVQVGLQSELWDRFPCHSSVANLIIPNSSFNKLLNTIELSYQHTIFLRGLERVSIKIPKTWDIYQAYFRAQGYEVSPSDKSFYANGLLGIAGGLEQAEILRSLIAYRILDTLADKSTPKLAQEVRRQLNQQGSSLAQSFEEYLQGLVTSTGVIPQFKRNPRTFGKIKEALDQDERPQCLKVLSELVRIKAVQRGLDVKCPHCRTTIWYGISDLDERMKCLGCLETFDLPLTENDLDPIDRSFQYSLNPLANRAMDQDVLPVITALLTLKTVHAPMYHMVPGMNFKKVGASDYAGDFDFVYIHKHELYGGECKAGEILTPNNINTTRVAHQLGFRAFFFVTVKTFNDEGQELIRSYQQELANNVNMDHPFTVVVLDKRRLFEGGEPLPKEFPQ